MLSIKNVIGNKYGRLTVISKTSKRSASGAVIYKCKCDCGNITYATSYNIKCGHKKSCGCLQKESLAKFRKDLTGKKFGRLTVVKYLRTTNTKPIWLCKCDCGKEIEVAAESLYTGNTKSCGCLQKESIIAQSSKNQIESTNVAIIKGLYGNNKSNITQSGVKGVGWDKTRNRWRAYIMFKRKSYHLGYFKNKEDAIEVRKEAEKRLFGEFLNWYKEYKGENKK